MLNLDRSKVLAIIGIGIVLIIVFSFVRTLFRTETIQPEFYDALLAQQTTVELSAIAAQRASDTELRHRASIIASTVSSDFSTLLPYYEESFGKFPRRSSEKEDIEELEEAHERLDQLYREMVLDYLRISQDRLRQLQNRGGSDEFEAAVTSALHNHQTHIDALTR